MEPVREHDDDAPDGVPPGAHQDARDTAQRAAATPCAPLTTSTTPPTTPSITPTRDRDRVLDAVKAFALGVVIIGHAFAWDTSQGGVPGNVAETHPDLAWLTWVVQVLPLFFVAGGAVNLGSWHRSGHAPRYLRRRLLTLGAPVLVYAAFWTGLLLPLVPAVPEAELAGHFLAQLTWFMGVYAAAVATVPWTSRWTSRPILTLGVWLLVILAVDVVRFAAVPALGWLNIVLVWGWLHQLGYHLPALRRLRPALLATLAAAAFALTVVLTVPGPYASALVTFAADAERSNFTPPTVVIATYGLTQALILAALYPLLDRVLRREPLWRPVGAIAQRAVGLYLWHIPGVGIVAGLAWAADFRPALTDLSWWVAHVLGTAVVVVIAWFAAGLAGRAHGALLAWGAGRPRRDLPIALFAALLPIALLLSTVTGYATWAAVVYPGVPSSSLLALAFLTGTLWGLAVARDTPPEAPE